MNFRKFLEENDTNLGDVKEITKSLPKSVRDLLTGFTIKFGDNPTLPNDNAHVGQIEVNKGKKEISLASSTNYSRSFIFLHEVGHLVWAKFMEENNDKQKTWNKLIKNTNHVKDSPEEIFSHSFANTFCKNKYIKHYDKKLEKFIKELIS